MLLKYFVRVALKSLSCSSSITIISVGFSGLFFLIQVEVYLDLGMESDLRSKHGYLRTYALRLLSLLASSDTAGREGGMPPHYCHVGQGLG